MLNNFKVFLVETEAVRFDFDSDFSPRFLALNLSEKKFRLSLKVKFSDLKKLLKFKICQVLDFRSTSQCVQIF